MYFGYYNTHTSNNNYKSSLQNPLFWTGLFENIIYRWTHREEHYIDEYSQNTIIISILPMRKMKPIEAMFLAKGSNSQDLNFTKLTSEFMLLPIILYCFSSNILKFTKQKLNFINLKLWNSSEHFHIQDTFLHLHISIWTIKTTEFSLYENKKFILIYNTDIFLCKKCYCLLNTDGKQKQKNLSLERHS